MASKRKEFHKELNTKLKNLKNSNPREYWKILNGCAEGKKIKEKVSLEVFFEHFKNVSITPQSETSNPSDTSEHQPNPALNEHITMEELRKFLSSSSNGKACGPDSIQNEFLKELRYEGLEFVLKFFNKILDTGIIPDDWSIGTVLPLYKNKGRFNLRTHMKSFCHGR